MYDSSPETKIFIIYFSKIKYLLYISQSIYNVIPLSYTEWKDLNCTRQTDNSLFVPCDLIILLYFEVLHEMTQKNKNKKYFRHASVRVMTKNIKY